MREKIKNKRQTEHNNKIQALKEKIALGDEKVKKAEEEIESLKGLRDKQNAATRELVADLRAHREKVCAHIYILMYILYHIM